MRKTILLLFAAILHLSATANIPDCWDVDSTNYKKGSYTVSIEVSDLTGPELAKILEDLKNQHLSGQSFPSVIDNYILLSVDANPESSQRQAEAAMRRIQKHRGVSVDCVALFHPMSR